MIAPIGMARALGGVGLEIEPGTGLWWSLRPLWVLSFVVVLAPVVAIFLSFEAAAKASGATAPGPAQAVIGALTTCAGLGMMALSGIGADGAIGVNVAAVALVVAGVGLATRRIGGAA